MQRYSNAGFGKRDLHAENHWKDLEFADFKIERPVCICLGGNGTTDSHDSEGNCIKEGTRKINNVCATDERLMGLQEEEYLANKFSTFTQIDILGFSYGKEKITDTTGSFTSEEQDMIVKQMLLPLCLQKDGNALSVKDCCKNFSLVTFFSHCWGAREVGVLFDKLRGQMKKIGFNEDDVKEIFSYSAHITYSPFTEQANLPTFKVVSLMDNLNRDLSNVFNKQFGRKLNGIEITHDESGSLYGKPNMFVTQTVDTLWSSHIVNSEDNSDLRNLVDEHYLGVVARNERWVAEQDGANADAVSKTMAYVVSKRMANSLNCFRSDSFEHYQPLSEIVEEAKDILLSYTPEDLAMKIELPPTQ